MKTNVTGLHKDAGPQAGFSIVELMVSLAVLAILAAMATPSFLSVVNTNRLAAASNELTATLQTARMESTRRGVKVIVCPSDNGTSCTTGARWRGWISFADANGNKTLDGGELLKSQMLTPPLEMYSSASVSSTGSRIVFRHDGFAYDDSGTTLIAANMRACIPTSNPQENARDLSVVTGARVSLKKQNSGGVCGAPGNP